MSKTKNQKPKMQITSLPTGFGTYRLNGSTYDMVSAALKNGYRHFDTATLYRNEKSVGKAINDYISDNDCKIDREDLFVTTKIPKWGIEKNLIEQCFLESMDSLNIGYIDLLLLHCPIDVDIDNKGNRIESSWKKMEELYEKFGGKIRNIGVSNYKIEHLERVLRVCKIRPYVNQIEVTPFLTRTSLVEYCEMQKIQIVSHSTLTKGEKLDNEALKEISAKYGKTPAQILLKWARQKNFIVIPRTKNCDHLVENIAGFTNVDINISDISDLDMKALDGLNETYSTHPKYL